MTLIDSAISTFRQAAQLNLSDPARDGSLLRFPDYGQVVMTGDLHGHRRNFEKIVRYCRLETTPVRHVLLHEMVHAEPKYLGDHDRSIEVLLDAAKWKMFFPEQVHFLQSNHELAQLQSHEITKGGRMVTDEFERGVAEVMGTSDIEGVLDAIDAFIASFPLAARTPNRVFFAHSLPDAHVLELFDANCVLDLPDDLDYAEGGSVYQLVWGRRHTPELLDRLGKAWDVDLFIIGHQPQEFGHAVLHDRVIIVSSDNDHGVLLPVDCRKRYTAESLAERVIPCAGVP